VENSRSNRLPQDASMIYIVGRVNQGIRREMRARLSQFDLSVAEYTTLSVLDARPQLSNAQLSRRALVTPQSMLEILAELERRGLVERHIDPDHALILRATLTPEGRDLLKAANPAIEALHDEMFAGMTSRQREAALTAMRTAMTNLSRPAGDHPKSRARRARGA
jgi:DNA-binding MarR family transcriptional regulator